MNDRILRVIISVAVVCLVSLVCHAESNTTNAGISPVESARAPEYSIEDLNLVGAAVTQPKFSDTLFGTESGFRRALFSKGILLRLDVLPRMSVDLLNGPAPAGQQAYVGQGTTWITGVTPALTADLRQLHLRNAQLRISGGWRWTNWNPAGPKTVALTTLYFYKMWGEHRVEFKVGYTLNDLEFVGMQVGGSLATGAQGVYSVLPFEVGMSHFPLTAPSLNVRLQGPKSTYLKVGAQRSLDAAGGTATEAQNPTGFRFIPKGDSLLLINEAGFKRSEGPDEHYAWLRGGFLNNQTRYNNFATNAAESGNYCAYVLADYQLRQSPENPARGFYVGASSMIVPARFNAYHRYYEARAYQKAPFESRPDDVISLIAGYRSHSPYVTSALTAQGKTVWRDSASITGNYSLHLATGTYLTVGLGYLRGAAITPRVSDGLILSTNWSVYF